MSKKSRTAPDIDTVYFYDIDDVEAYGSANNRLMLHTVEEVGGALRTLVLTTYYYYNAQGNVTNVVIKKANPEPGERQASSRAVRAPAGF